MSRIDTIKDLISMAREEAFSIIFDELGFDGTMDDAECHPRFESLLTGSFVSCLEFHGEQNPGTTITEADMRKVYGS